MRGGGLYLKLDIILVKKSRNRVVFQDQAVYARTSFRGAKACKIGKKGCVFGHIDKFWKRYDGQIKENACKNAYLGYIFTPEKYVFIGIFWKSFCEDDIRPETQVPPPQGWMPISQKQVFAYLCIHFKNFEPMEGPIELIFALHAQNRCMYEVTEGNLEKNIYFSVLFWSKNLHFFPKNAYFMIKTSTKMCFVGLKQ